MKKYSRNFQILQYFFLSFLSNLLSSRGVSDYCNILYFRVTDSEKCSSPCNLRVTYMNWVSHSLLKPVTARRWLHPDFSLVTCEPQINPWMSWGNAKIGAFSSVVVPSGDCPHCPCWLEPQQNTCPMSVRAAVWWDPAATCIMVPWKSGNTTVDSRWKHYFHVCKLCHVWYQ